MVGYKNFKPRGSENNHDKMAENPRFGRRSTVGFTDNLAAVRDSVGGSPKMCQELGISPESLQIILKTDLQLYL